MTTTVEQLAAIIEVDSEISDLTPFINTAHELVLELCSDSGYSQNRLDMIECWLAAHFYAIRDPRAQSESAGVSASYQGQTGMYLSSTSYGQQAIMLDTSGSLAALNMRSAKGKITLGVTYLGTEPDTTEVVSN